MPVTFLYCQNMWLTGSLRARRTGYFFLALFVFGLSSCRGGSGGNSAPVPPQVTAPLPPGISGAAAELISELGSTGKAWFGLVEGDTGEFSLTGENPETNTILQKLPDHDQQSLDFIPSSFSRFAYFRSPLGGVRDPGRYLLWGRQSGHVPPDPVHYDLKALWTCLGCTSAGESIHNMADGRLDLLPASERAELFLNGHGLDLQASLLLGKTGALIATGETVLRYEQSLLDIQQTEIHGSLFGSQAEETGLLFSIAADDRIFTGAALGTR